MSKCCFCARPMVKSTGLTQWFECHAHGEVKVEIFMENNEIKIINTLLSEDTRAHHCKQANKEINYLIHNNISVELEFPMTPNQMKNYKAYL